MNKVDYFSFLNLTDGNWKIIWPLQQQQLLNHNQYHLYHLYHHLYHHYHVDHHHHHLDHHHHHLDHHPTIIISSSSYQNHIIIISSSSSFSSSWSLIIISSYRHHHHHHLDHHLHHYIIINRIMPQFIWQFSCHIITLLVVPWTLCLHFIYYNTVYTSYDMILYNIRIYSISYLSTASATIIIIFTYIIYHNILY